MANMALKMAVAYFEERNVHPQQLDENVMKTGWNFKGGSVDIFFFFDEDGSHVHVEGVNFIKVPEDKYDIMYRTVNQLNGTFIHVKYILDEKNGQINARDDDIISIDTCGAECYELMIRMVSIIEESYPTFMKAIWL